MVNQLRNLSLDWLSLGVTKIEVTKDTDIWSKEVIQVLRNEGQVCIVTSTEFENLLTQNLQSFYFEEIETSNYSEAVHIKEIRRTAGKLMVTLQIRDFIDA